MKLHLSTSTSNIDWIGDMFPEDIADIFTVSNNDSEDDEQFSEDIELTNQATLMMMMIRWRCVASFDRSMMNKYKCVFYLKYEAFYFSYSAGYSVGRFLRYYTESVLLVG